MRNVSGLVVLLVMGCSGSTALDDVRFVEASLTGAVGPDMSHSPLRVHGHAEVRDADGVPYLEVILPVAEPTELGMAQLTLSLFGVQHLSPGTYIASEEATLSTDTLPDGVTVQLTAEAGRTINARDPQFEFVWASLVDELRIVYGDDGSVLLDFEEQVWPGLNEALTRVEVRLEGFPSLPTVREAPSVGTTAP